MASRALHVTVLVVSAAASCRCEMNDDDVPMAVTGRESWVSDGATQAVERTYFVRQGLNDVVYVMEHRMASADQLFGMDDERALSVAFPLMKHAYETRAYERAQFKTLRGRAPARILIGVDLIADAPGGGRQRFRVVQSIGEIVGRLHGR